MDDDVPDESVRRHKRFREALEWLAWVEFDPDALIICGGEGTTSMVTKLKIQAFLNAAITNSPPVLKKLQKAYQGTQDLVALAERVRLEVVMRRLD